MAIFDPTRQIQELGQQTAGAVERAGQSFVQNERMKSAQTERIMSQLGAIRDEAAIMHQEFLQEEITAAQQEIAEQIFEKRKNGNTKINIRDISGLNRKISGLKNMAANSQVLAQKYGEVAAMIEKDPYVSAKETRLSSLTNIISDANYLKLPPEDVQREMMGIYSDGINRGARVGDRLGETLKTFERTVNYTLEGSDEVVTREVMGVNGIHDPTTGQITKSGEDRLREEFFKMEERMPTQEEMTQMKARLNSKYSRVSDMGSTAARIRSDRAKGGMTVNQVKDSFSRFVNGITSGSISEVQAASASDKRVKFLRKSDVVSAYEDGEIPEDLKKGLDSMSDSQVVGVLIEGEPYGLTEESLKQAYIVSNNENLGQDARAWMQSHSLDESGINLFEDLRDKLGIPTDTEITPRLPSWNNWSESLINSYSKKIQSKIPQQSGKKEEAESQEPVKKKASEKTVSLFK